MIYIISKISCRIQNALFPKSDVCRKTPPTHFLTKRFFNPFKISRIAINARFAIVDRIIRK